MRIVVTGANGFVGRATCANLLDAGHDVTALVRRVGSDSGTGESRAHERVIADDNFASLATATPLDPAMRTQFLAAYSERIAATYKPRVDGKVLLRFPRLFFVAVR